MIVGYAGAQAGFTANLMVAGTDTLYSQGLTNDAIKAFMPESTFTVDATCNCIYDRIHLPLLCSDRMVLRTYDRTASWKI